METRNCQNCKQNFNIDSEDFSFYEKMKVPAPTWCPECRLIRRFNFRNESTLFRRPDAHTEKEIFSGFSPKANVKTYENSYWYGTDWQPLDTGVEYDFDKPFFEQFRELLANAPLPARSVYNMINSDYCNEASETKNSYLCFNTDYLENCAYSRKVQHIKDSFDIHECSEDELCYEDVMVDKSYRTFFSADCESCVDVWFSKGLRGCTDCFGCVNLTKKSHYFFNEPCTKDEYLKKVSDYNLSSYKDISILKKKAQDFWLTFPVKFNHTLRCVDSTGERVFDCKNVKNSHSVRGGENMKYCQDIQPKASNSYDYSVWGAGSDNMYECMTCGLGSYNLRFCFNCWEEARDLEYSVYCMGSSNCFGCVGLYKKQYCIFNKQYSKEEYVELRDKIIDQMNQLPFVDSLGRKYSYGEFFPPEISPIAYNESTAYDFFLLDKSNALERGYVWRDIDIKEYQTTIDAINLPDLLSDVGDSIVNEIIKCSECSRAYRIVPAELQFYKRIGLPLPHKCHNCRFTERFKFINPPKLWQGSCMCNKPGHEHEGKCANEFETSYAPDRPEIIYCEKCYQQEVN